MHKTLTLGYPGACIWESVFTTTLDKNLLDLVRTSLKALDFEKNCLEYKDFSEISSIGTF